MTDTKREQLSRQAEHVLEKLLNIRAATGLDFLQKQYENLICAFQDAFPELPKKVSESVKLANATGFDWLYLENPKQAAIANCKAVKAWADNRHIPFKIYAMIITKKTCGYRFTPEAYFYIREIGEPYTNPDIEALLPLYYPSSVAETTMDLDALTRSLKTSLKRSGTSQDEINKRVRELVTCDWAIISYLRDSKLVKQTAKIS